MAVMDVGPRLGDEERWSVALDRLLVLREMVAEVIDLPTAARTGPCSATLAVCWPTDGPPAMRRWRPAAGS